MAKKPKNKKIVFKQNDKVHADFKVRCQHENITQSKFFRLMMRKFLERDSRLQDIVDDWKEEKGVITKRQQDLIEKERKKKEEFEEEFMITDKELYEMYDFFDE